jgi:hypothetical protein
LCFFNYVIEVFLPIAKYWHFATFNTASLVDFFEGKLFKVALSILSDVPIFNSLFFFNPNDYAIPFGFLMILFIVLENFF